MAKKKQNETDNCIHSVHVDDPCIDCMADPENAVAKDSPGYTLTVLESILTELRRISSLLEQGNSNTGLKRPGVTKFGRK